MNTFNNALAVQKQRREIANEIKKLRVVTDGCTNKSIIDRYCLLTATRLTPEAKKVILSWLEKEKN